MLSMAKRTKKQAELAAPAATENRTRVGANLNVWINEDLMTAFLAYKRKTRRTKTTEVEVMMEEYLTTHGFWPPRKNGTE